MAIRWVFDTAEDLHAIQLCVPGLPNGKLLSLMNIGELLDDSLVLLVLQLHALEVLPSLGLVRLELHFLLQFLVSFDAVPHVVSGRGGLNVP